MSIIIDGQSLRNHIQYLRRQTFLLNKKIENLSPASGVGSSGIMPGPSSQGANISIANLPVKDEDNMVSNSDVHLVTQQSVKEFALPLAGGVMTGPLTVGVDDTGHDVKFFGATSGQYMLWDESADKLIVTGEIEAGSLDISGDVDVDGTLETDALTINGNATGALALLDTVGTSQIDDDAVTYAKVQNVAANNVLLGNDDGAGSAIQELSKSDVLTLLNVADGAQVNVATNLGKTTATGQITITSSTGTDVVIGEATDAIAGLMSTTHHDKLDGIAASANNYSLPIATGLALGGIKVGSNLTIDSSTGVLNVGAIALTTVQTAANQAAQLALTVQEGDVVVRTDQNKSYIRNSGTAGDMTDFQELLTPTDAVLSVTTTDGTYINLTPNTATTGAINVTADLSAADGTADTTTRFLSKDNTWDVPAYTSNTFRTIKVDTTNNGTANETIGATEELKLIGGTAISLTESAGVVTINGVAETYTAHDNISAASSVDNSGRTYIQDITLDSNGHVTGLASATETVTNTFRTVKVDTNGDGSANNTLEAAEDLMLKKGSNITLAEAGGVVTISSTGTIDGSGTANDIVMWSDSDTLTDAPIAISGNDATFAGNIKTSASNPFVTIEGNSSSYVNGGIQFITNHASSARGLGTFYYNAHTDIEWFAGLPYDGNDAFVINRNSSYTVPSSESSPPGVGASAGTLFSIASSGTSTFHGDVVPSADSTHELGTNTVRWLKIYADNVYTSYLGAGSVNTNSVETLNLTINGAQGSDGQVLTSTGSGVGWENATSTDSTKMPLAGGTFTGDVTLESATANKPVLNIKNTNADANPPQINLLKHSASPANNDDVGRIYMRGYNNAGSPEEMEAVMIRGQMTDISDGTEDSKLTLYTYGGGSQRASLSLEGLNATFAGTTKATTFLIGRTTAAGVGASLGDINGAELGPGYLSLSRDDTADAKQIVFEKNDVEHSYIKTGSDNLRIVAGSGKTIFLDTNGNENNMWRFTSSGIFQWGAARGTLTWDSGYARVHASGTDMELHLGSGNDNDAVKIIGSDTTFAGNIALGGGTLKTYHSNVTSVIALDDNGSIFTRADETYIGHNIYYDSGDEGTAIEAGYSTLLKLTEGEFYIYGTAASVSADATTSIQERFKIDTSGNATFTGDVTVDSEHLVLKSTSPEFYFHTEGNHPNFMIAAEENVSSTLEFSSVAASTSLSQTASDYTPILKLAHGGTATFSGTISATNFSGSSSGTNTGDQDLSSLATVANPTFTGDITIPEYIYHTGDANTKFGFSGDDTYKVITTGQDALTIDSNQGAKFEALVYIEDGTNPDGSGTSSGVNSGGTLTVEGRRDGTANLLCLRARDNTGSTLALPADQGGLIRWQGFDGTDFSNMGAIAVNADGQDVANGDSPSKMIFYTVPDGSDTPTTALTIDRNQNSIFAGDVTISGGHLGLSGFPRTDLHATWNQMFIGSKGSLISENGSGGIAGMTISDNLYIDSDTGTYAYLTTNEASQLTQEAGVLTFKQAASGTAGNAPTLTSRFVINADGTVLFSGGTVETSGVFAAGNGAVGAPAFTFASDLNTGIYRTGADSIGFATGGSVALTIGDNDATFAGKVGVGVSPTTLLHLNGTGDAIRVESTNAGAGGAQMDLLHFTASPADEDTHGMINMGGYYTGTTSVYGSQILSKWTTVADRHSRLEFKTCDTTLSTVLTLAHDKSATFAGDVTITGHENTINIGAGGGVGTFVTSDANDYPRITTPGASAQLGLFRSGSAIGGVYIGADSGGFDIRNDSFATLFQVDMSGNVQLDGVIDSDGTGNNTFAGKIIAGPSSVNGGRILAQNYSDPHYLGVISSHYSNGNIMIGYGAEGKSGSSGYVSTFANFSGDRSVLEIAGASLNFKTVGSSIDTAVGSDITLNSRFSVSTSGTGTFSGDVVAYGSPSDISLKENIKPIDNALDKVSKLKGVTFDWKKSDSILKIKEDIGFIAQDVKEVLPDLVRTNDDGKLSLRDKGIIPVLVEAIKELEARVKELENK